MGKSKRVAPNADLPADAIAQGEKFVDAMIAQGHSYTRIMDNFRLVVLKRAMDRTRRPGFPAGCIEQAAKLLKSHRNVVGPRIRESADFFQLHGIGRKAS